MTNFYDKECTKEIECFYDPCYRTGDYYKRNYIYNRNSVKPKGEYEDTLANIVLRCSEGNEYIWFVTESGKEIKLKYIQSIIYLNITFRNVFIQFEDELGKFHIFDSGGRNTYLTVGENAISFKPMKEDEIDLDLICLTEFSFVENFKSKDNEINPNCYKNVEPWSDEEREIVRIRSTTDPYYKSEEYK